MSDDTKVLVEILQGTQTPVSGGWSGCASAASCGSTTDYADLTEKLADDLKDAYGDKVTVKYVDVDKNGTEEYPIVNQVLQMGYSYPITIINGEPKFAGGIMMPEIKSVIDELLK